MGSSSYISNLDGEVVQHIEYVPFGEVFLEEKNTKWNTPYLFTSKELDRETGMYYFGARYQDPKLGIFISVDALAEKFKGWSSYIYAFNNPVKFTDPTGMGPDDIIKIKNNGSIQRTKTNNNFDILTNESGKRSIKIAHKDGKSQIGKIQTQDTRGSETQYMLISDNKVARKVFEFAASTTFNEDSNAEFGLDRFSFSDGYSVNLFQTGGLSDKTLPHVIPLGQIGSIDLGNGHLIQDSNWIENNHSHPGNFSYLTPSGFERRFENGGPVFVPAGNYGDRGAMSRAQPNKQYLYGKDLEGINYIEYTRESVKIIGNRK